MTFMSMTSFISAAFFNVLFKCDTISSNGLPLRAAEEFCERAVIRHVICFDLVHSPDSLAGAAHFPLWEIVLLTNELNMLLQHFIVIKYSKILKANRIEQNKKGNVTPAFSIPFRCTTHGWG